MTNVCEHGSLKRSCQICELKAEIAERDAMLKQALEALEHVKPMVDCYWGGTSHDEAIAAIKGVLNERPD